jgi:hypothetical protein
MVVLRAMYATNKYLHHLVPIHIPQNKYVLKTFPFTRSVVFSMYMNLM